MPSKRFYCTECKKVKRVSRMPASVDTPHADAPENRVGVCRWHTATKVPGMSHRAFLGHKPRPSVNVKRTYSAPSAPPKPKGRKPRSGSSFNESAA